MNSHVKTIEIEFEDNFVGTRLDKALADYMASFSRSQIKEFIKAGQVIQLSGKTLDNPSYKVQKNDKVTVQYTEDSIEAPKPEKVAFDIIHEDDDILVINKPINLVVHPGAGNPSGTLVNGLIHHTDGQLSDVGGPERPGIVHRLDKDTSGLMIVAKNNAAHKVLAEDIKERKVKRFYDALVWGVPMERENTISTFYGRSPHDRVKMAVLDEGKDAVTHYTVKKPVGLHFSLIECQLETGRTHQIRVHMNHIGHGVIGDQSYKPQNLSALYKRIHPTQKEAINRFKRQALHASHISFEHPTSKEELHFTAPMPSDFLNLIILLSNNHPADDA